jgi:bifunctional non-homologous end joining protein LigD
MLAYSSRPFDSPRHLYEIKWDGTRCILFKEAGGVRLQNRRLLDITRRYPELGELTGAIRAKTAILDGELVVFSGGLTSFPRLQEREHLDNPLKISLLSREMPATYVAFDILYLDGRWRTARPLRERKKLLARTLGLSERLLESMYVAAEGRRFFEEAVKRGFEGAMAKDMESPYLPGKRSRYWLKIKPRGAEICFIIGYTPGKGARSATFGALALATPEEERWVYRGKVGTGFGEKEARRLRGKLEELRTAEPPSPSFRNIREDIRWVRPELRAEVLFQERTRDGMFRAPVFKRLIE